MIESNPNIQCRTTLSTYRIKEVLLRWLRATYFQWKDQFYEQREGAARGKPLSPVIANFYMEQFEEETPSKGSVKPNNWLKYVDVTFVIWNEESTGELPPTPQQAEIFHQVHKRNERGTLTSLPGCSYKEIKRKTERRHTCTGTSVIAPTAIPTVSQESSVV